MEKVTKIAEVKKCYTIFNDEETRGFFASVKRLQKDCEDAEAAQRAKIAEAEVKSAEDAAKAAEKRSKDAQRAAKKDAAKESAAAEAEQQSAAAVKAVEEAKKRAAVAVQKAAEVQKRINASEKARAALEALAEVMQRKNFASSDICKDFLLQYIPQKFNAAQQLCSVKKVDAAEAEAVREEFAKADAVQMLEERESELYIFKPILLYTANTFLSLFCSAADARSKQQKAAESAAEKEAKAKESAAREAKRIAEYKRKIAEYEAKQQKAQ